MSQLNLSLFGQCQTVLNGRSIDDFRTKKAQALLIYLAAEPHKAHRREQLMSLFWPGMPESSARSNLRQILFHLRRAIPESEVEGIAVPLLIANRHTIQLNPEANIEIDTEQFAALQTQIRDHAHLNLLACRICHHNLKSAIALYRGSFLAHFYLGDSNAFEEWAEINRQHFRRKALDMLDTLTTIEIHRTAYAEARVYAERQLEIDSLNESAWRQLMKISTLSGQRAEALLLYESYRRLLAEELNMAPTTHTTELYEKIQAGELRFDRPQVPRVRGYDLKEKIGAGAYGIIHRAVQPVIGREVAVKIIRPRYASDPAFIRRFEAEAQIIARLEHPHIVPLYDYWREPGGAFLVMRFLRGGNLLAELESGSWTPEQTAACLNQIAPALSAAHKQGIIHRDIKPANILFDEGGNAYLSDFGIAKDMAQEHALTEAGEVVGTFDYISPEQLQKGLVTPQSDIYSLGAVLYEMLTGEKPFPNLALPALIHSHLTAPFPLVSDSQPGLPALLDEVIQRATAKLPKDRFPTVLAMAEMFSDTINNRAIRTAFTSAMPDVNIPNPYKGLRAYHEADSADFYGRESLTGQLTEQLLESRFLAIVGPSGSGKSSLVKAGLIPALRQGALPDSDKWYFAKMVPGEHPLEELELALWPIAVDPPPSLQEPMQRDARGLLRIIRRVLPAEDAQLLLFVDQFEELFTMVEDEARRNHFLESLYVAITAPRTPLRLVVALRADFYDRPLQYQPLAELFKEHTALVLPLNRDELTWAIQEPARRVGVELEDGLLATIVADVDAQPGSLPLLQYALTEVFASRWQRKMTRQSYAALGGVPGAVAGRADEIFNNLSPDQRVAARQLFLRLVTLGEEEGGTAISRDTRRRIRLSEAQQISGETDAVLGKYGEARLLTFDHDPLTREPTVEVAHEALLLRWDRLSDWISASRTDIRMQRQLATLTNGWQANNRNEAYLLRGARLTHYEAWQQQSTIAMLPREEAFLEASLAAWKERQAAEAERRERELETARQLAASERKRAEEQTLAASQLRRRAIYLTGALVIAGLLAIVAILVGNQSRKEARIAFSRELAAAALNDLDQDPERSILLALEALATAHTVQAESVLHEAVRSSRIRKTFDVGEEVWGVDFSPDGRHIATGDVRGGLTIWDVDTGEVQLSLGPHEGYVNGVAFNSDGSLLASAGDDNARVWDPASGQELFRMEGHAGPIVGIMFSPDGQFLLTSSFDRTAKLWDVEASIATGIGQELHTLSGHGGRLWRAAFSRDGSRVVTASADGTARIWDVASGIELLRLQGWDEEKTGGYESAVFGQDGTRIVTVGGTPGSADMSVWDGISGERLYQLAGHREIVEDIKLSPDGTLLATAASDGKAMVWDFASDSRQPLFTLAGHKAAVTNLAFSPGGTYLVTASRDGTARLWDISAAGNQEHPPLVGHTDYLTSITFSPDGKSLATAGNDTTARVWDISIGRTLFTLSNHEAAVNSVVFSPDGKLLATASEDNSARLWDATTGNELRILSGHGERIYDFHFDGLVGLAFSPDGHRLATAGVDGQVKVWDVASGAELLSLSGHPEDKAILSVAFSPDGRLLAAGTDRPSVVKIWDSTTGEEIFTLPGYEANRIFKLAFSPDGNRLAVGNNAGQLDVWKVLKEPRGRREQSPEILFSITSAAATRALSFNASGTQIMTGGIIWDATTGEPLLTFDDANSVGDAVFSPDGSLAAAAGLDGLVRLYLLDLDELMNLAQSRVTRLLTLEECRRILHIAECSYETN